MSQTGIFFKKSEKNPTASIIMKMQTNPTMTHYLHLLEWLLLKTASVENVQKLKPLHTVGGNINHSSHSRKQYRQAFIIKKMELLYDLSFCVYVQLYIQHIVYTHLCICVYIYTYVHICIWKTKKLKSIYQRDICTLIFISALLLKYVSNLNAHKWMNR